MFEEKGEQDIQCGACRVKSRCKVVASAVAVGVAHEARHDVTVKPAPLARRQDVLLCHGVEARRHMGRPITTNISVLLPAT